MGAYREGMEGMEKAEMLGLLLRHAVSTEWTTERQKWALSWGTHGWSSRGQNPVMAPQCHHVEI